MSEEDRSEQGGDQPTPKTGKGGLLIALGFLAALALLIALNMG